MRWRRFTKSSPAHTFLARSTRWSTSKRHSSFPNSCTTTVTSSGRRKVGWMQTTAPFERQGPCWRHMSCLTWIRQLTRNCVTSLPGVNSRSATPSCDPDQAAGGGIIRRLDPTDPARRRLIRNRPSLIEARRTNRDDAGLQRWMVVFVACAAENVQDAARWRYGPGGQCRRFKSRIPQLGTRDLGHMLLRDSSMCVRAASAT